MNSIKSKKVCIVLVNYNGSKDTLECISSLLDIDYPNYKIIVIDNNSNDENLSFLIKNCPPGIDIISEKINHGFSGGNNIGIRKSLEYNADYVCLLNNDTVVDRNFLTPLVKAAVESDGNTVVCSKINYYYDRNKTTYGGGEINYKKGGVYIEGINRYDKTVIEKERFITFASGSCMLMSTKVINKTGFLPEKFFLYYEDAAYSVELLRTGFKIKYLPDSIVYHQESVSTKKGSPDYQYYFVRNRLYFIRDYFNKKQKLSAYPMTFCFILKKLFTRKFDIYNTCCGVRDFLLDIDGKRKSDKHIKK